MVTFVSDVWLELLHNVHLNQDMCIPYMYIFVDPGVQPLPKER